MNPDEKPVESNQKLNLVVEIGCVKLNASVSFLALALMGWWLWPLDAGDLADFGRAPERRRQVDDPPSLDNHDTRRFPERHGEAGTPRGFDNHDTDGAPERWRHGEAGDPPGFDNHDTGGAPQSPRHRAAAPQRDRGEAARLRQPGRRRGSPCR